MCFPSISWLLHYSSSSSYCNSISCIGWTVFHWIITVKKAAFPARRKNKGKTSCTLWYSYKLVQVLFSWCCCFCCSFCTLMVFYWLDFLLMSGLGIEIFLLLLEIHNILSVAKISFLNQCIFLTLEYMHEWWEC